MKKILFLSLPLLFIAGCFQTYEESKTELINKPGGKYEFQVNKNYQEVYRILKEHFQWKGDLYTDIKQAHLYISINDTSIDVVGGETIYVYADIKAIDEQNTNVIIYYKHNGWRETAKETMELVKK